MDEKDIEAIKAIINDTLGAAIKPVTDSIATLTATQGDLVKNQTVLADTLKALPPAAPAADKGATDGKDKAADAGKSLTLEDVAKLLDERDSKRQQTAQQSAAREAFIKDKLAKLPAVYQGQLGNDAAKWNDEATKIQQQYEADFKAGGGKADDVGGANREGGSAGVTTGKAAPGKYDWVKMPAAANPVASPADATAAK
jgi:hypothetical protein